MLDNRRPEKQCQQQHKTDPHGRLQNAEPRSQDTASSQEKEVKSQPNIRCRLVLEKCQCCQDQSKPGGTDKLARLRGRINDEFVAIRTEAVRQLPGAGVKNAEVHLV